MIAAVDEFILFDTVQFTKNDWRNRNKIKTPKGVEWLSVPVGQDIHRRICDVKISDSHWATKHIRTLESNYRRAPFFADIATLLSPFYREREFEFLSDLNRNLIECVCGYLGIQTKIRSVAEFEIGDDKTGRLVDLCAQTGANVYVSGPAARTYLDESQFKSAGIVVEWFDYSGYPEYRQMWGEFRHDVSIVDLLFCCGLESSKFMKKVGFGVGKQ